MSLSMCVVMGGPGARKWGATSRAPSGCRATGTGPRRLSTRRSRASGRWGARRGRAARPRPVGGRTVGRAGRRCVGSIWGRPRCRVVCWTPARCPDGSSLAVIPGHPHFCWIWLDVADGLSAGSGHARPRISSRTGHARWSELDVPVACGLSRCDTTSSLAMRDMPGGHVRACGSGGADDGLRLQEGIVRGRPKGLLTGRAAYNMGLTRSSSALASGTARSFLLNQLSRLPHWPWLRLGGHSAGRASADGRRHATGLGIA